MDETPPPARKKQNLSIPVAIIIAGLIIAGAVLYTGSSKTKLAEKGTQTASLGDIKFRAISPKDHIRGNPNADITIIEYSDTECPFCKRFHETMKQVMDIYGKDGKVAWVYRHFPIEALHSKAKKESAAAECASIVGGSAQFWDYLDAIFVATPSNDGLDLALLPKFAEQIGLDKIAFNSCMETGQSEAIVTADFEDGRRAGVEGTPFSLIVETKTGKVLDTIPGAYPYEQLKSVYLDPILKRAK